MRILYIYFLQTKRELMEQTSTANIDWTAIVGKIRKGKSVLVLGPGAFQSSKGGTLQEELIHCLRVSDNAEIQKYYKEDNFFLFSIGGGRAFTCEKIEDFYVNQKPDETLKKLVKIPFHVILSVTPDKLLPKAFEMEGFPFQFDHYKRLHEPASIQTPVKELPLIYNLFGCIDDEESLILTHNDLYDYFKSIFARKSMPDKLKTAIHNREVNCFIFLGVPFDKWYMQLLLRELEIHRNQEDFIRYAANQALSEKVKTFCTEQFTIQFVSQNIPEFVQTLYQYCQDMDVLRERTETTKWEQLRTLIATGELERAIEHFVAFTKGTSLGEEVLGISGRYRRLGRKKRGGQLDFKDFQVQENQIIASLLELIGEAATL